MPTFPRNLTDSSGRPVLPTDVEYPDMPGPLFSSGWSGKDQTRSTTQRGRTWREVYGLYDPADPVWRGFLADLTNWHRNGTTLDIEHILIEQLGAGGGTPVVNGASQTGSNIITSGWPNSTLVLKKGDVVKFTGINGSYDITADVTSSGAGAATLPINPPIFVGGSPTNGVAITIADTGVAFFKVRLVGFVRPVASAKQAKFGSGIQLMFKEAL